MSSRAILMCLLALLCPGLAMATAQRSDDVEYNGKTYSLIGVQGELPTPRQFGMKTEPSSSANWRGYFSVYAIENGRLQLKAMTVSARKGKYRPINGIEPDLNAPGLGGVYSEIDLALPFTGKLRLGGGFISEHYVHMGFQKPSAFREVYDLAFESGHFVNVVNRSREAESIRGRFAERFSRHPADIESIEKAFSLEMEPLR